MSSIYDLKASDMSDEEWGVIHNFATKIYIAQSKGAIYSKADYDPFIQDLIYTIIIDSIKKSKENSIEMSKAVPIQSEESDKIQVTRDEQER